MRLALFVPILYLFVIIACSPQQTETLPAAPPQIVGKDILTQAIKKHGGPLYDSAHYQFLFRGKTYTFHNQGESFIYTKTQINETDTIIDTLTNQHFIRHINRIQQSLNDSDMARFSESLNSVMYFATLPHKLTDPAVKSQFLGTQTINTKEYDLVQVSFSEENGGTDFEDTYLYWINKEDHTVDFLAYNFHVNGGGVRFRSAYNRRIIEGVYFQDYINFKAPVGTPLDSLALMYAQNTLQELSRIETEKVISLQ